MPVYLVCETTFIVIISFFESFLDRIQMNFMSTPFESFPR